VEPFLETLNKKLLVCDGAIGTLLYQKGEYINHSYDQLNLTKPDLVREVHREYISAGADIIETNSFSANKFRLARYGLENKVTEINLASARNAVDEARGSVYVAGSVGSLGIPLKPYGKLSIEDATDAYKEQVSALIEGGVNLIILETFFGRAEIEVAVNAVRSLDKNIPLIAQLTFEKNSRTPIGEGAEELASFLDSQPVDVIGTNCSVGPAPMLDTIAKLVKRTKKPVSAMPNAGYPHVIDGRHIYMATPEYFVTYAKRFIREGAKIIGGCCGTTPEHIKLLVNAAKALSPSRITVEDRKDKEVLEVERTATAEKSTLSKKLSDGKFVTCVEVLPPKGPDPSKVLKKIKRLHQAGVDAVNIPDGPRASARMSPMSLALLIKQEIGIEPLLHYTCRDRNILGMQSDILGANATGLKNILAVTGDPPKLGNYPEATAVYDVDAIGLVKIIDNLNRGLDVAGNSIGKATAIHVGVGVNPVAINLDEEIRRLYQKVENGAEYILTQPIFNTDKFMQFKERISDIKVPILLGILPLASLKMAEFLHNEVPGMEVPEDVRKRIADAGDNASQVGTEIASESLRDSADIVQGAYVMSPAGGIKSAIEVLQDYL